MRRLHFVVLALLFVSIARAATVGTTVVVDVAPSVGATCNTKEVRMVGTGVNKGKYYCCDGSPTKTWSLCSPTGGGGGGAVAGTFESVQLNDGAGGLGAGPGLTASTATGAVKVASGSFTTCLMGGIGSDCGWTSGSGIHGLGINKPEASTGPLGIALFRGGVERWSFGEDTAAGPRSYFALWSDRAQRSGGAWVSGDVMSVWPAGSDSSAEDPSKWCFNCVGDPNSQYTFEFRQAQTAQTTGEGQYSALFNNQPGTFNSGGVIVNVAGPSRLGLRIAQQTTGTRYGGIQTGRQDGGTFRGWEFGSDIQRTDSQKFQLYDAENATYRFTVLPTFAGFGTTTPDSALQVNQDTNGRATLNISNPNTGNAATARLYVGDGSTGAAIVAERFSSAYAADSTLQGDVMLYGSGASAMLHFGTAGVKRMTLKNDAAWLGIGVDPPTAALDVVGALRLRKVSVSVTGNDAIVTADRSFISLTNTSGTNTITLNAPSSVDGQVLDLHLQALTAGTLTLADSGNADLVAAWTPAAGDTLSLVANGSVWVEKGRRGAVGGGSGYATVKDETTALTQRSTIAFLGSGVSCGDNAGQTECTIAGGGGSGDLTDIGDCDGPACFTSAGDGTLLRSITDLILELDDDANGTESFQVKNGANSIVFEVDEAGVVTAARSSTPGLTLGDLDTVDADDNVRFTANCTVTTSGAEDCDATIDQQVDGAVKTVISSVADGAGTIGSDQNTAWTIITDGTGNAELVVPAQSISGAEMLNDTVGPTQLDETVAYSLAKLSGKIDRNDSAVDDDDCTGEQGLYWYDTTDSRFERCNANSGVPIADSDFLTTDGTAQTLSTSKVITEAAGALLTIKPTDTGNTAAVLQGHSSTGVLRWKLYGNDTSTTPGRIQSWYASDGTTERNFIRSDGRASFYDGNTTGIPLISGSALTGSYAGALTLTGGTTFNTGAVDINVKPTIAGIDFDGSTVSTLALGSGSSTTASVFSVAPASTFPGISIPGAWTTGQAYTTPLGKSSDSGKQYKLITASCTSGGTAPTGTGTCSVTTSTACTAANGTNANNECPGGETCTNSKNDGACTWQYIGQVHSGAATFRSFYHDLTDSDNFDGIGGNDTELTHMHCYNCTNSTTGRQDTSEYALGFQFTPGWTSSTPSRYGEYFLNAITPAGITWKPFSWNLYGLQTETPSLDYTIKASPSVTAMQMTQYGVSFGGTTDFAGQVEVYGSGIVHLGGTFGGVVRFEGTGSLDANDMELGVINPTAARSVNLPNQSGTVVVSALSSTSGPAAWAANTVSCATACANIGQANCADSIPLDGTNTALGNCTGTTGNRMCQCY